MLIGALLASSITFGQTDHPSEFTLTQSHKVDMLGIASLFESSYIVVESAGTAVENYSKVLNWVKLTYKNPSEVIVASSEGEYIKINGFVKNLNPSRALGLTTYADMTYSMTFFVKDNRMKIEISSLQYYSKPSQYNIKPGWRDWDGIITHNGNGKVKKPMVADSQRFLNYFNSLAIGPANTEVTTVASSGDDW